MPTGYTGPLYDCRRIGRDVPAWFRWRIALVRHGTNELLSEEKTITRALAASTFRGQVDEREYWEQFRTDGAPLLVARAWADQAIRSLEDALSGPDFRRFESEPLSGFALVLEDTA